MDQHKSYRIRTTPGSEENAKLNITLDQDYDFVDILSLKLDQKNIYRTPKSEYGCIIGRVMANGGMGVPNARISIFIPVTEATKMDMEKRVLYPYDNAFDKNYKKIRYNLLQDQNINECHQSIGSFPLKRDILDNNDILEVFDEYFKFSTVTNSSGDYMLFGVPIGSNQIHCDIDLSDCGHLSQMPRDMYYKGYSVEQFESSTQFKKDTNLDNLAQVFSEDTSVYVYPFWGDSSEDEVGITRHDINISYKFETTCVFIGSVVTDSDNATTYASCLPQASMGTMGDMTTKQGTIEMIRLEPDGRITNYKIKGNQLIDGDGVWCYQIPMNLDYYTTDEFGNEVLSDNPSIGIPSRTDVRFKIKIEQPADLHKRKACYLVPHNPDTHSEVDYKFGKDTSKTHFVSLFKNNVYSVKSYIPRLQISTSYKSLNYTGIKNIQNFGSNLPFPYNDMRSELPLQFNILCLVSMVVIVIQGMMNALITWLTCMGCGWCEDVGFWKFRLHLCIDPCAAIRNIFCNGSRKCSFIDPSWCQYANILIFPSCYYECDENRGCPGSKFIKFGTGECPKLAGTVDGCKAIADSVADVTAEFGGDDDDELVVGKMVVGKNPEVIKDCLITTLAEEMGVSKFNFSNDWINGVLYFPTFNYSKRRKKKRKFLGIFGKKYERVYEEVCSLEDEEILQPSNGADSYLYGKTTRNVKIFKTCSPKFNKNTEHFELLTDENKKSTNCYDNLYEHEISKSDEVLDWKERRKLNANKCHISSSNVIIGEPFINRIKIDELNTDKDKDGETVFEYYYRPINKTPSDKNVNLFKTDIILLGSLDSCNKHGIWDLYNELPITTYQMPGPMYELDYRFMEVDKDGKKDIAVNYKDTLFMASGKNWGYRGGKNISEVTKSSGMYRFYSENVTGGLFYGIGCTTFETKLKTCVNLERICELAVDLDVFMTIEGVCDEAGRDEYVVTPQGFIGKDQFIRGVETRQKFATLNQHRLNRYIQDGDDLKDNLIYNQGKRYYNFDYTYPTNFDGKLSGTFNNPPRPTSERPDDKKFNLKYYNTLNESYIDPEYFRFRYGNKSVRKNDDGNLVANLKSGIALHDKDNKVGFFQPVNSFYFYFGIRSGSTAIEKLRQKFTSQCYQSTEETVQIQVNVLQHPFICYCDNEPPIPTPRIKIEVIGVMSNYHLEIRNDNGDKLDCSGYNKIEPVINCSGGVLGGSIGILPNINSLVIEHTDFNNEGAFFVSFLDKYGNMSQSTFTLRYQNRVYFTLNEIVPIYDNVNPNVTCLPDPTTDNNAIFSSVGRETCALVALENIGNIFNKNCKLENYNLRIKWREINIGEGAKFKIVNNTVSLISGGTKYKLHAYGQIGNGGVYIQVTQVNNTNGAIINFMLVNQFGADASTGNSKVINPSSGYENSEHTVEKMVAFIPIEKVYPIPFNYYNAYTGSDWDGFRIYLCEGEYSICLESKHSNCAGKDNYCNFITIKSQPGVSLTFKNDMVYAKYFKPQGSLTPRDDKWWDAFFKFLRETSGKDEDTLLKEFEKWYTINVDINKNTIRRYIALFKEMWMPMCSSNIPVIYLRGTGYSPPMRTLLYGAKKINNLLCASDSYNTFYGIHGNSAYRTNDIPYQTQQSSLFGVTANYMIRNDQNDIYRNPNQANAAATQNNLTPEALTFTTSRLPIQSYSNYEPGGFYAGVIGKDGTGRAAGYDNSLSEKIKKLQADNPLKDISAWELLHGTTNSTEPGLIVDWNESAGKYLFKFHILDQTLKIFKQWNRIAAEHKNYYEPNTCTKRDIPAYFDIFYINGPPGLELTMGVGNSEFDLRGMEGDDNILKGVIEEIDKTIAILATLGENDEVPDGLAFITISSGISDYRTHLGTCPLLVPTAKHFYSTGRYVGSGGVSIEQREVIPIIVDGVEDEEVTVLCSDIAVGDLNLEVNNTGVRVSSHFNPNCGSVTNHYSHNIEIPNLEATALNSILSGNWKEASELYELYEMRYSPPVVPYRGTGAAIFWRIRDTQTQNFSSIFTIWKRNKSVNTISLERFNTLIRGKNYKVGDQYRILSTPIVGNDNAVNTDITVYVTGSVVGISIDANQGNTNIMNRYIRTVNITGGGINANPPSGSNPSPLYSNVGGGIPATLTFSYYILATTFFEYRETRDDSGNLTGQYPTGKTKSGIGTYNHGSGYVSPPTINIPLYDQSFNSIPGVSISGKGILGSNYFDVPSIYKSYDLLTPSERESIYEKEPGIIPGTTTKITGVGGGFMTIPIEDSNGDLVYEKVSVEGALYSFAITPFTLKPADLNKRGQILRQTMSKSGKFFWQKKTTVNIYDWMSDLFSNRNQKIPDPTNGTNPEDLLYYMTTDDWANRFNFPYYTKNFGFSYADINSQVNEPNVIGQCLPANAEDREDFTSGTLFHNNTTIEDLKNQSRDTTLTLFRPFHGNIPNITADSTDTMFYNILHENETSIRAFSQPMDFGNYIFIDEDSITYHTPNPLFPDNYTISFDIEIRGTNAFKCYGYDIKIEEGKFNTYMGPGSIDLQANSGYDLFDTEVQDIPTILGVVNPLNPASTGILTNARWIRLEDEIKRWIYKIPKNDTKIRVSVNNFSSRDIEKIVRVSATDVTGVEIYTYISLFRWIDNNPLITYCVYNCNKDMEIALNTGIIIDFEWKNNINNVDYIGKKIAYLTKYPSFPNTAEEYPEPIIMQGKNLIHTHVYNSSDKTDGCTVLSDGETIPRNYKGNLYLWFVEEWVDEDLPSRNDLNETDIKNIKTIEVTASSCYIPYKIIAP